MGCLERGKSRIEPRESKSAEMEWINGKTETVEERDKRMDKAEKALRSEWDGDWGWENDAGLIKWGKAPPPPPLPGGGSISLCDPQSKRFGHFYFYFKWPVMYCWLFAMTPVEFMRLEETAWRCWDWGFASHPKAQSLLRWKIGVGFTTSGGLLIWLNAAPYNSSWHSCCLCAGLLGGGM